MPIGEDPEPGEVPHWGVTFAVDDADAAAETAASLGATVLVPPFDAPWVRMSIVRDPQGAVFTASQFVPPSWDSGSAQTRFCDGCDGCRAPG